mmetsp:Transcript_78918/g.115579  ORF Transcript_78918/g.115579 Transcript_78918/m.115579 type:complete len:95 (+) Transcript_78918:18-302(+)
MCTSSWRFIQDGLHTTLPFSAPIKVEEPGGMSTESHVEQSKNLGAKRGKEIHRDITKDCGVCGCICASTEWRNHYPFFLDTPTVLPRRPVVFVC